MRNLIVSIFAGIGFILLISCARFNRKHPPCDEVKQVKIDTDRKKEEILHDYVDYCGRKEWKNDKGIVMLREFKNEQGLDCWLLIPSIDDSYKDNPPERFATFQGDIILVFSADSMHNVIPAKGDKNQLNRCLEQIIGDRVYIRPTIKGRWTDGVRPFSNEKITEGAHRFHGGNGGTLIIVFNADGTYRKFLPV
ncbi:hypothetical protein MUK70_04175 [Dyadobacter chenwenxiniae]|uniref:Lipoprotein n=1 Tax=Dyadobacter chenwenxiniae TaxID=2906456 RepID=A0A9X1PNU2_9BACT|nr:hypothetical protein [Dyadobacter chenwenxiniae]MCF0064757.1 hypothetical protein [Dyadobacter chenwenxiniae]UON84189.1 hypothetical protein MUK70_04175 [Dyadobacter chenwenxiniae]